MASYGLTIPLNEIPLSGHKEFLKEALSLGYKELWSAETAGYDAFSPLVLASDWVPEMKIGTAIVPAFTRGPATIAMSAASLANIAPGRFTLGVGASSNVIVKSWNGLDFERPYQRTRDLVRFLKMAMEGEKVSHAFETFEIDGFRLTNPPAKAPEILVAALREQMLKMAGREADGAIINWLSSSDAKKVVPLVGGGKKVVARVFVAPSEDAKTVRSQARYAIAAYLNVPVYREFHRWLGRGDSLAGMWEAWEAGDRKAAVAAIPDEVVDDLVVHGTPADCRRKIEAYFDAGVEVVAVAILPYGVSEVEGARLLLPKDGAAL